MRSESGQSLLGRGGRKRQIPGRGSCHLLLRGNPKMEVWKMIFLFNGVIFRFHVNFQGCRHISDVWIYDAVLLCKTRWWQLKYSSFSPLLWGRFPFWLLFFQRGWFNHQLEEYLCMIMQIFVCRPAVICPTNWGLDLLKLLGFYMFNIVLCRLEGKPLQVVYRGLFWWKCCAFECLGVVSLFVCVCVCVVVAVPHAACGVFVVGGGKLCSHTSRKIGSHHSLPKGSSKSSVRGLPVKHLTRWFQTFFIFTPIWLRFLFWLIFFNGVETTN